MKFAHNVIYCYFCRNLNQPVFNRPASAKLNKNNLLKVKRLLVIFVIGTLFFSQPCEAQNNSRGFVNKVVIDPGHGGRAPGAVGRRSKEKDITLAISLKLGNYIRENMEDVEVIFTRETDIDVPLHERARIANDNNADLFISIHCNSVGSRTAIGTETFVMGLHRNQANLEVARRENKAILYEDDYLETYDGFDPNSPEASIIFTLYQNAHLEQSLQIASLIQQQFRDRARRVDRGVKQAGFLVLYNLTMPGILVEAGFLSNPREEEYLMSETGQSHIASAIFRALRYYKEEQDALAASRNQYAYNHNNEDDVIEVNTQINSETDAPADADAEAIASNVHLTEQEKKSIISFRVQFAASSEERPHDDPAFSGLQNVSWYYHEGLYKYTVGDESSLESAAELQRQLQDAGYNDAFVVAFHNNERINPSEAIQLLQHQNNK
jgi:N-acetylmuramoyl-L-alanine amidase